MKLKYHLWIALGIIIIALFLTQVISETEVVDFAIDSESTTSLWDMMYDNLLTSNPTDDLVEDLAAFGLDSATANVLIEKHELGNSVLTGLLGLIPMLAVLAAVALVSFKEDTKKYILYILFGLVIVSIVTVYFTAPSTVDKVETLFNEIMTGVAPLGTMMKAGNVLSIGAGFFVGIVGALYGIAALVLNQFGKIAE